MLAKKKSKNVSSFNGKRFLFLLMLSYFSDLIYLEMLLASNFGHGDELCNKDHLNLRL